MKNLKNKPKFNNKSNRSKYATTLNVDAEILETLKVEGRRVKNLIDKGLKLLTMLKGKCFAADSYFNRFENAKKFIDSGKMKIEDFNQSSIRRYFEYDMMKDLKKYVEENEEYKIYREDFLEEVTHIIGYKPSYRDFSRGIRNKRRSKSTSYHKLYDNPYKLKPINKKAALGISYK